MKVAIGSLAQSGLEARVGPDLPAAVNAALVYYVGKLNSGRRPPQFPDFLVLRGETDESAEDATLAEDERLPEDARPELEVDVDERIEAALCTDAERQGVSATDLAGHAVLVYLAELDRIGDPEPGLLPHRPTYAATGQESRRGAN